MKKIFAIIALFGVASWAVDAYYRHHQRTITTSLEADLVNREVGIDASARNSLIAKKADGNLIHIISKEMDTASLNGVLNVAGQANFSGPVKMANYTSGRLPYFTTGGLVADITGFTFNGTTLTAPAITSTGALTGDTLVSSKFYEEGSFTGTLTGCTTSPTGTVKYVRVGKVVHLKIPAITGTSNTTAMTITGMPASIYPPADARLSPRQGASCQDNTSQWDTCTLNLTSAGVLKYTGPGSGTYTSFTSSGTKGTTDVYTATQTWTYTLQ
jgi:hypothetical protein